MFRDLDRLERELRIVQQEELDSLSPRGDELETIEAYIAATEREAEEIAADLPKVKGKVKEALLRNAGEVNARHDA